MKIFDSELKVMEELWAEGTLSAGQLAKRLQEKVGWNRNTTYTVVKKLIDKGAVERQEPGFLCSSLVSREEVQRSEADDLVEKLFGGSPERFLSAYLGGRTLTPEEHARLRALVDSLE
ncbi:MAG: BlaI/MecI/CopY family transcriptional regulator [Oscillospiraceae bacterium]|nr:BlaI/MecI/CopY family transcriptional regulator [Oscillospiraceae bacterium]